MFGPYPHLTNTYMHNVLQVHTDGQNQDLVLFKKRAIVGLHSEEMMQIDGDSTAVGKKLRLSKYYATPMPFYSRFKNGVRDSYSG